MANFQTHHHHHHHHQYKSTHHQNPHGHGSRLTESPNSSERSNTDHLPHTHDNHEHADIHLHTNPQHKQHSKHCSSSKKFHHKTSTISPDRSMSAAGCSLCSSFSSSASSTCSSTSGSSSSSSSFSSASSSSNSSSSSSFSSSSFSSSSSSSSSWSSDSSLEKAKFASKFKKGARRLEHSQSCTDISRRRRAFEEDEEDTVPLLNEDGHANKSASLKKYCSVKKKCEDTNKRPNLSHSQSRKSTFKKESCQSEIVRKAKSMEVLPMQNKQSGEGELDEKEIERRKEEARRNIMEEKKKFSAFLNEITRQVISPSRLQTLGVTDAHRAIIPAKSQNSECKGHKKPNHFSRRSGSTNSVSSSALSHTRKHSSGHVKSLQPCNSIEHHHHQNTKHRNPKHLHHSFNSHTSNKTGSSKSHLRRSEHGHKARKKQQALSSSHLKNDSSMDTKRSTQRTDSLSPTSHHYSHINTHRRDHLSLSSHPHSPSHHPHRRTDRNPEHRSLQTESHHSYLESHRHHSTSLSRHHQETTHQHVPRAEAHHHYHSHSESHNQPHHDDHHSQSSHKPSPYFDNDHHAYSESHHHVPSSPLYHHCDQSPSYSGTNFPRLKTQVYSQPESFHHSPSPSHQHQYSDANHQTRSPHQYYLYSKKYDHFHSESPHHSPSPSCHFHHGDQKSQSLCSSPSSLLKSQDHSETPPLHHLHKNHKNTTPHYYTLRSETHGLHSPAELNYCDSYSRSHHSSLPDIQYHSSNAESSHPMLQSYSTDQDFQQYQPPSQTSHYYDNSHDSSSDHDHHLHHDSTHHQFHGQHHSSYPDVHHHHHHSNPPSDNHHHSYPNVHTHSEEGLTSPTDHKPGRCSNSLYTDRHHQHRSNLDHHPNPRIGDSKPLTLNRHHHSLDSHYSQHHPHSLKHTVGHHQFSHPDSHNSTLSKSYHQHDHQQSAHYHSISEAKFDHHKDTDYHHNSPESNKDSQHYIVLHHNSQPNHKHQEFPNHSHTESPYHQLHTESQHYLEHSKTHQHSHVEFPRSSHCDCHKMPSHMESHHLHHHQHHHKYSESHHHSHPKSLHHSSHTEIPLQYGAPKSHHHHEDPESYTHSKAEPQHHSDVKWQHDHPESRHYRFHTKEHHYHGGDASPLRHSPVGEKATSPCSSKSDSSRNTESPISHDDQSMAYKETAMTVKEKKGSEYERIMMLQEQNEDLHNTLRQTVVRMECLGAEFITEHHQLESELQRTRVELSSMMEKFTRLQANYSSIQQTDDFQENETHFMDEHMDAEREKLNQQISELTKQLSVAKTTIQSLGTINVTSMLQEALVKHLKSDDPIKPAVAPPPFQFMDSDHYTKSSVVGDEESLGPVLEEDETDWSEMGEEAKDCACSSLERGQHRCKGFSTWQQEQGCWVKSDQYRRGDGDTESESGGEKMAHKQGLQIPHLQFSIHPEFLPVPLASLKQNLDGPGGNEYHIYTGCQLSSPIRLLSASLEGINSTGLQQVEHQGHLKCTKGKLDLHQPHQSADEDWTEDELTHNWKEANKQQTEDREKGAGSSVSVPMANLESAQKMLNHFIQEGEKTKL
ncbi:filaggrin [Silurus meridionalis]|nr:filaggrin [Silurus meridionalis]